MMDSKNYYSDSELDEIYGSEDKATNSFKSLLPLLAYRLLQGKHEGPDRAITQTKLLEELESRYELGVDRRALSRTLQAMCIYGKGVVVTRKGVYYDARLDDFVA